MRLNSSRTRGLILAALSAILVVGCDSAATAPVSKAPAGSPVVIRLSPEAIELLVGDQTRLAVTAADQNGFRIPGTDLSLAWSSSDPSVVAVDAAGVVTARAAGAATITAIIGKVKGSAVVHTLAPTISSVKLAQREAQLGALGDTVRLKAEIAWNGHGTTSAAWTSLDPAIARVDTQGLVIAVGAGSARIVASAGARADTGCIVVQQLPASVIVSPAATTINAIGDSLRLGATVLDARGNAIPGVAFTWTSLSPKIATVDPMGVLVSRGVGLVLVTVAAAGHLDTASINVRQVPTAIAINPSALAVAVGQSSNLAASAADSRGVEIPGATFHWQSSSPSVAAVDGAGGVRGAVPGSAIITASLGGVSAAVPVTVGAAPVAAISISPASASLPEGANLSLKARLTDSAGNLLHGRAVTWSSSNPAVVTVGADGEVRAVAAGIASITASAEGKVAIASVTVPASEPVKPNVAAVSVTPATASALVGSSVTLVATPRDAAGNALTDRTITWTSKNPTVASVNSAGVVTALAAGTATMSASSEGRVGTATLSVTAPAPAPPAPVASVMVSPSSLSLPVAGTASLSAVLRDAAGGTLTGRALVWSSSNPAIAPISVAGVVTAIAAGKVTITATSEGKSGTSAITVTAPIPAPVATVTLSPTSLTLDPGDSHAISAFIKDAAGNLLAERALTWSSSAAAVAKVSSDGVLTAVGAGVATITATSEGKSGTTEVTVRALLEAPPAAEPELALSGVVFQDSFDGGARAGDQKNFGWTNTPSKVVVSDRIARSGRYSLEFIYTGKADCEDVSAEQRFKLGAQMKELWMEYYMYFPKGSEGVGPRYEHRSQSMCASKTATNNKFLRIWGYDYNAPNKVGAQLWAQGSTGDSRVAGNAVKNGSNPIAELPKYDNFITDAERGRWVRIRWHLKLADVGRSNGVVQLWKDGKLVIDERSMPVFDPNGHNYWDQGYLMGWSNSGFTQTTSIFLDDFRIIGSNPGW